MEKQLHRGQIPLMLFKNSTKKRDVRERIFWTTQVTFVTELRVDIVHDLKKLASSTTVVHIHPQNHPHFAYTNSLHQISTTCFILFYFCWGGGVVVYYIVQCINSYARVLRLKVF
jgi:hypothetical protein